MLAISTRHANLMRAFSMNIDGENHSRSQRSNLPDFRDFIPFRDESESDEFCTRVNGKRNHFPDFRGFEMNFLMKARGSQKAAISILELIESSFPGTHSVW